MRVRLRVRQMETRDRGRKGLLGNQAPFGRGCLRSASLGTKPRPHHLPANADGPRRPLPCP